MILPPINPRMKVPHRSLAYGWAKAQLKKPRPQYSLIALAWPAAWLVRSVLLEGISKNTMSAGVVLVLVGFLLWERVGMHEVYEDQERIIDGLRSRGERDGWTR